MSVRTDERLDVTAGLPIVRAASPAPRLGAAASRPRSHTALVCTLVVLIVSAVGMLYLMQTNRVATLGYEASRLQRQRERQALANEQLSYDVARYQALPLIERVAIGQLGMQPMTSVRYLDVPRPAIDELPLPENTPAEQPSLLERVRRRLTGAGAATHADGVAK